MSTKALLKAVGEAVRQGKFEDAIEKANEVLGKDPKNFQA